MGSWLNSEKKPSKLEPPILENSEKNNSINTHVCNRKSIYLTCQLVLPILRNVCLLGCGLLFALLHRNDINNKEIIMLDKQFLSLRGKDLGILRRIFLNFFNESSRNQNLLWVGRQNFFWCSVTPLTSIIHSSWNQK